MGHMKHAPQQHQCNVCNLLHLLLPTMRRMTAWVMGEEASNLLTSTDQADDSGESEHRLVPNTSYLKNYLFFSIFLSIVQTKRQVFCLTLSTLLSIWHCLHLLLSTMLWLHALALLLLGAQHLLFIDISCTAVEWWDRQLDWRTDTIHLTVT